MVDLGAFKQIDDLDGLARLNGIEVPRLRGYRLMGRSEPYSEEEIEEQIREIKQCYRDSHHSLSDLYYKKYEVIRQCETWNKYAGRKDVLYIHSRIGYNTEGIDDQPWFLDHVCDAYDGTYCDIYALITIFPDGE